MKMKRQRIYTVLLTLISFAGVASAQNIQFEGKDFQGIGVYDTWEESPFRTGKLKGNYAVVDNPERDSVNNSYRVLAIQRSRYGSNTFGVRIDLREPFELTPTEKYIHLLVRRPYSGRIMVVGLGKRTDRNAQSADTEQFWAMTTEDVPGDAWQRVSLVIKGAGGIEIHSLVVVPDCESPHHYTEDAICYVDGVVVSDSPLNTASASSVASLPALSSECLVSNTNRNGEVTLPDGSQLMSYEHPAGKPLRVKVRPEVGFTHDGMIVHYGYGEERKQVHIPARKVNRKGLCIIPARYMNGVVELEGLFVEVR